MKRKAHPERVDPSMALSALDRAGGDLGAAYSQCVILSMRLTGRLAPGFDNADLQAWYEANVGPAR